MQATVLMLVTLMCSVHVGMTDKIEQSKKNGYFVVIAIVVLMMFIFALFRG